MTAVQDSQQEDRGLFPKNQKPPNPTKLQRENAVRMDSQGVGLFWKGFSISAKESEKN